MINENLHLICGKNLWRNFHIGEGLVPIIKGIDFILDKGDSISIMGDSGSGKSTLLNLLSGLDCPDKGQLFWKGELVSNSSANLLSRKRRRFIGFIFQSFHLISDLTVFENLYLAAKIGVISSLDSEKNLKIKVEKALSLVRLEEFSKCSVLSLSGGEKQRVAIARALINDPSVIFADEPTGNLDDRASEEIMQLLLSLVTENLKSLVLVTHNVKFSRYTNSVLNLKDGIFNA